MEPLTMAKVEASLPLLAKEGCLIYEQIIEMKDHTNLSIGQKGPTTK